MFFTYHLVEGREERVAIAQAVAAGLVLPEHVELLGIAQSEDRPHALAFTLGLSPHASELGFVGRVLDSEGEGIVPRLLDYLSWELTQIGKEYLLIRDLSILHTEGAWLAGLALPASGPLLCKLGSTPLSALLRP